MIHKQGKLFVEQIRQIGGANLQGIHRVGDISSIEVAGSINLLIAAVDKGIIVDGVDLCLYPIFWNR